MCFRQELSERSLYIQLRDWMRPVGVDVDRGESRVSRCPSVERAGDRAEPGNHEEGEAR